MHSAARFWRPAVCLDRPRHLLISASGTIFSSEAATRHKTKNITPLVQSFGKILGRVRSVEMKKRASIARRGKAHCHSKERNCGKSGKSPLEQEKIEEKLTKRAI